MDECPFSHINTMNRVFTIICLIFVGSLISAVSAQSRLVFSKSPIDPANPTNLTESFNTGDNIYGLLLLDRTVKEFASEESVRHPQLGYSVNRPTLVIDMLIDNIPLFSGRHNYVWDIENKDSAWNSVPNDRFFFFDVAPNSANIKTYAYPKLFFGVLSSYGRPNNRAKAGAQYYSHQISRLTPGEHTITFKISGKDSVEGSFKINGSSYAVYNQLADKLESASAQNATLPAPKMRNAALEASIKTAVRNAGNRDSILRVIITNPDWYIQRNSLGRILFRGIFATIAFKKANGSCYFVQEYFKQDYAGGRYGTTRQDGRAEARPTIPCENINK